MLNLALVSWCLSNRHNPQLLLDRKFEDWRNQFNCAMMQCPSFRWDKSVQDSELQIVWLLQKLLQVISGVETSSHIDSFDYTVFENRTFLAFACGVGPPTPETRESEEFEDFEKALVKSGILGRLVAVPNVAAWGLELQRYLNIGFPKDELVWQPDLVLLLKTDQTQSTFRHRC